MFLINDCDGGTSMPVPKCCGLTNWQGGDFKSEVGMPIAECFIESFNCAYSKTFVTLPTLTTFVS